MAAFATTERLAIVRYCAWVAINQPKTSRQMDAWKHPISVILLIK